jgi:hypothetical protein
MVANYLILDLENVTNHAVAASDLTIEKRVTRNSRALDWYAWHTD